MTPQQGRFHSQVLNPATAGLQAGVEPYSGQRVSGPTDLQQQYFGMAPQVAGQQMAGFGRLSQSQAPLEDIYKYGMLGVERAGDRVMEQFAGADTGMSGGAALGLGRTMYEGGLGVADMVGQASFQNQNQQYQALNAMGGIPSGLAQAGNMQYDIANQQLLAQQQQWAEGQDYNNPWLNVGNQLMGNVTTPVQNAGGMGYGMLTSAFNAKDGVGDSLSKGFGGIVSGLF